MKVRFHKQFAKQLGKYPKIQAAFGKRLDIFFADPFDVILSNHALTGTWQGYRSINISGDLWAIYELIDDNTAFFVAFGTHSQLYK
ncbi:MAG TPA: type II toxin-antitoxin system mRNA interferase toxin, RelE/StbE family [Patescibacteria group bacterium]